jgi:hypothetical protein
MLVDEAAALNAGVTDVDPEVDPDVDADAGVDPGAVDVTPAAGATLLSLLMAILPG